MTHSSRCLRPSLLAIAVLAACAAGAAHAQFQDRTIRVAMVGSKDHPAGVALTKSAECVAAKSGGKVKLRPFFDSSLGTAAATISQLRSASLDGALVTTSDLGSTIPQMAVFDLPFLLNDAKEADQLLDGPFGKRLSTLFPNVGLVNLSYWENGFRQVTNSRRPLQRLEDLQGLKIRVIPNKVYLDTFSQLGANPVPMAFSEVYSALETKAIDGQENPIGIVHAMKLYEVQKHLTLTRHVYSPVTFIYSKALFDKLSPDEQKVLGDCAMDGRLVNRQLGRDLEVKSIDFLKGQGVTFTNLSPTELDRLREKTRAVHASQAPALGEDLMSALQSELKRMRAN
jgi:tripartite ATP-independent transporter DctP family solute receptor